MWAQTYPEKAKRGEIGFVPHEGVRALARLCWARRAARVGGRDAGWWAQVAGMESHAKRGDGMMLGNQVQHLRMILGAAESSTGGGGGEELLHPADMGAFGFGGAGELLDMASAVSLRVLGARNPEALTRSSPSTRSHSRRPTSRPSEWLRRPCVRCSTILASRMLSLCSRGSGRG